MTHSYPSNINPEQFDKIKPILESARKKTRPRSIDLYDVFCGVLYVLKVDVSDECCQKSFLNGVPVTTILASGVKRKMSTPLALLKNF